ncbi:hypothetical protein EYF80_050552 [Liparis tanakae]|uniref:Uncharacterized protein n=1 Tax=Liparis tanakae TaxID=230148 RepID=A0A4Z2FET2_9TELE|nr:hypothetical protein EYF80_050552 [Liparis tanakae]
MFIVCGGGGSVRPGSEVGLLPDPDATRPHAHWRKTCRTNTTKKCYNECDREVIDVTRSSGSSVGSGRDLQEAGLIRALWRLVALQTTQRGNNHAAASEAAPAASRPL